MNNGKEFCNRLKKAEIFLNSAKKDFITEDFREVIQNSQSCIELSLKAIISYFAEPEWIHEPSAQLIKIIKEKNLENMLNKEIINSLYTITQYSKESAPWHSLTIYGADENGIHISVEELYTKEKAEYFLKRAEESFSIAKMFFEKIKGENTK